MSNILQLTNKGVTLTTMKSLTRLKLCDRSAAAKH